MNEIGNGSGKNDFIGKKAYEIAYALWRVAAYAEEKVFADILRNKAMRIIGFAADTNYIRLDATVDAIQAIIKFAVDVNCITIGNAAILVREIGNLKSAIADMPSSVDKVDGFDLSNLFSSDIHSSNNAELLDENLSEVLPDEVELGNRAEMRQSAIIERVREIGNCRLADIQVVLPNVSERTIRYDLESLVRRNLIERFGPGGRASYYRSKPSSAPEIPHQPISQ